MSVNFPMWLQTNNLLIESMQVLNVVAKTRTMTIVPWDGTQDSTLTLTDITVSNNVNMNITAGMFGVDFKKASGRSTATITGLTLSNNTVSLVYVIYFAVNNLTFGDGYMIDNVISGNSTATACLIADVDDALHIYNITTRNNGYNNQTLDNEVITAICRATTSCILEDLVLDGDNTELQVYDTPTGVTVRNVSIRNSMRGGIHLYVIQSHVDVVDVDIRDSSRNYASGIKVNMNQGGSVDMTDIYMRNLTTDDGGNCFHFTTTYNGVYNLRNVICHNASISGNGEIYTGGAGVAGTLNQTTMNLVNTSWYDLNTGQVGAIAVEMGNGSRLLVEDSYIGQANALLGGGASIFLNNTCEATFRNVTFFDCTALNGGGLWVQAAINTSITMMDCNFTQNKADGLGGGFWANMVGGALLVADSTFSNNVGPVFNSSGAYIDFSNTNDGAALSQIAFYSSQLENNTAVFKGGGNISFAPGQVQRINGSFVIDNSTLMRLEATSKLEIDGKFYVSGHLEVVVSDVTLASSDPITLASYSSVDGEFASVVFVDEKGGSCQGKAEYLATTMQVTMQCPEASSVPVGAIVGGVVGGVVFLALIVGALCWFFLVYRPRQLEEKRVRSKITSTML